ncbi:RNA-directed DNA polymerase, eukaryota, reverse transcriptase zinc-binding domain protein [Tanacetum coccineum]
MVNGHRRGDGGRHGVRDGEKVKECQAEVDKFPHDEKIKEKSWSVLKEYQQATKEEYSLLCQKAKVEWLKDGDRNTAYFHKTIKERMHRGRIMTIRNEEGVRFENKDVATQIVKHFEDFLGQKRDVQSLANRQNIFINKLNSEEAKRMVRDISDSEINNAMSGIEDSKSPRPDGYTACFYKSAWSIVGKEISQAVKEFFSNGKLLGEVNATIISLAPKIPTPDKVSDFRPIACCNVLYKCIRKILTSRIKDVLGKLVGENQSAFIEGRQITDNILLSQELFKGYNRKQKIKKVAFKIDLQKSYDTISWDFLREILFSVNVNGERVGYFKGGRGLRQGDPISPYIFTLVMEVLNLLIQKNIEENSGFKYHFGCKKLKITHLCFADDLLVFCHGDLESVRIIKKSLDEFSGFSGLLPNMQKSTIFFGGLSCAEQQCILNIISFSVGKLPVRYLGVSLLTKNLSISDCKPLIRKVKAKVNDWKNKNLSYVRRVQLIASVLRELTKGKAKISWDNICKPKDQGGLGLKNLVDWNEVLMIKHLWNVVVKKETLWASPLSDFIDTRDIYDARLNKKCSIKEIVIDGRWKWPEEWNNDFAELNMIQVPMINEDIEDNANDWYPLVWFTQNIPRHAFVTWLAIQERIMTQDRIKIWKPNEDLKCSLYNSCIDSHDHLFFTCEFSKEVWNELHNMLNVRLSVRWNPIIREMVALPINRNIWSIVRRIVLNAAVYCIWQERNHRIFKNEKRDKEAIINLMKENTMMKLMGLKVKDSSTVKVVEHRWQMYAFDIDVSVSYVQRMSRDAIVMHEMFNGGVEMLSLYIRCSTDESRCYRSTLDVQQRSRYAIVVHEMFNGGVKMLSLYMRYLTNESRWSQDVIVVHAMLNKLVEMVSLYMRCSTEESRCYRYSLDVQRRSRDAIVVHKMFNGGVEMLSLCSTDESRCYRCTRDVQWMSQEAIVVHEIFNGGVEMLSRSRDSIVVHEMFNRGVEILSLYMRCSTKESRCYRCTRDV